MKNVMLILNGVALVATLGACSKPKVTTPEFAPPPPADCSTASAAGSCALKVSEDPADGIFNRMAVDSGGKDTVAQSFKYTPAETMSLQFEGYQIEGCSLSGVGITFFLDEYDADGRLVYSDYIPLTQPVDLQKAVSYEVRVQMANVQGCRSGLLSFWFSRT